MPCGRWQVFAPIACLVFGCGAAIGHYTARPSADPTVDLRYLNAIPELYRLSTARPDVVMLGDSLTFIGNWSELLPGVSVANRGVSGDDSAAVLARIDEVAGRRPRVICLLVGTNDLIVARRPVPEIAANVRAIAAKLPASTVLIIQSTPYVMANYRPAINPQIRALNDESRTVSPLFFDLNALLADGDALAPIYSLDGVHLTATAYMQWSAGILPIVRGALK